MYFHSGQRAQGLLEYALVIILVAILVIVMLALFGDSIGKLYSTAVGTI